MQIIKPLRIGYMSRPIADCTGARLALTGMVCFDLLNPERIYPEQRLWDVVTNAIGEQAALDHWTPKQRGEVLLWGAAQAPDGIPVTQMNVGLRLGDTICKTLVVNGERQWNPSTFGAPRASERQPFVTMPLSHDRAYGGAACPANPLGQGHDAARRIKTGATVKLPNLEYPGVPILHPDQEEAPAVFGPVDINWPGHGPGGTYDNFWRKYRSPAAPDDYDWKSYNVAPADQRLPGYFRGDEAIKLSGFHAEHVDIRSRLPDLVMRFFVQRTGCEALETIDTVLDTVCLFPGALCGVLIYRGEIRGLRDVEAQEIAALMSACESRDSPRTSAYYEEIFRLRTGEDRALHALSDFQLMPPFSAADTARLEARRAEVKAEQAAERIMSDRWFTAHCQSLVGFTYPAGYFDMAADIDQQEKEMGIDIPVITDLDRELGNIDMASLNQAIDRMGEKLRAKGDAMISAANEEFAKLDRQSEILRDVWRTGNIARLDELSPGAVKSAPPPAAFADQSLAVADLLENDPNLTVTQTIQALMSAFPSDGSTEPFSIDDSGLAATVVPPQIRQQFAAALRKAAAGAGQGTGEPPMAGEQSDTDAFLQSLGLASGNAAETHGGSLPADQVQQEMAGAAGVAGPDGIGEALAEKLGNMSGFSGDALSSLKASFRQAAQAQPAIFQKFAEAFEQPAAQESAVDMQKAFVEQMDVEQMGARQLDGVSNPEQRLLIEAQLRRVAEIQAQTIGKIAPDAVSNGKVDWAQFLDSVGIGESAVEAPGGELADLPGKAVESPIGTLADLPGKEIESTEQQNLRRAKQLALGAAGVYRLGPDLPPETQEERDIVAVSEAFFSFEDPEGEAQSNARITEHLQMLDDVKREAGGMNEQAIHLLQERVMADIHDSTGVAPDPNSPIIKKRGELMLALSQGGALLGHSIVRKVIPDSEALFRKARLSGLVPLIRGDQITPEIATSVGDIVRAEAARGVSLAGRDLAGANLRGAQLAGLDLSGVFFDRADLTGADLTDARCEGAVFSGAILKEARLCRAQLRRSNFGEAQLQGADLSGADLSEANLFKADFSGANLSAVNFDKCEGIEVVFRNANLDRSQCEDSTLIKPDFSAASLRHARWRKVINISANLSAAIASDADLRECLFIDSDAEGCDFSRANLAAFNATGSRFKGLIAAHAQAERSGWAKCDLSDADFSHARLEQSCFMKANLDRADLSSSLLRRSMLLGAQLREASLSGAQLFEATLRGADLTGADLRLANLHAADFDNAVLDRCDLTGSRRIRTVLETPRART